MIFRYKAIVIIILALQVLSSCKKQDEYLSAKRNKGDVTPTTVADFQAILDNDYFINSLFNVDGLIGTDNFYLSDISYAAVNQENKNAYTWAGKIWTANSSSGWDYMYRTMEYANIILEGAQKVSTNDPNLSNVRGQAAFYRSISLYTLAQLFCRPYDKNASSTDPGLPIRLTSDVNIIVQRSTLEATYLQMLADAKIAADQLTETSLYNTRPTKPAAYALLAKIYLLMGDYTNARDYAGKALSLNAELLDFNSSKVSPSSTYRFPTYGIGNPEVLWYASASGSNFNSVFPFTSGKGEVDPTLYAMYDDNDLRKIILFASIGGGHAKFRGTYTGNLANFCGIGSNEVYLIRAECQARLGNIPGAMGDLNKLLQYRYKSGTFRNLSASTSDDALRIILMERRKELPFTSNLRWEDLRRLNKDQRFAKTITRIVNGASMSLPPNDARYVLPIPDNEILLSGIQQNDR